MFEKMKLIEEEIDVKIQDNDELIKENNRLKNLL